MDPTNGITCPDMRRVIREALSNGWEWGGTTGTTHGRIVWPANGKHLSFGLTPSVASWKTVATEIHKVSGVQVWRKGNRKRSRKAFKPSGFSTHVASREAAAWHAQRDPEVDKLMESHATLTAELDQLAASGTRTDAKRFRGGYVLVRAIESELSRYHVEFQPYEPQVRDVSI